MTDRYIIQLRAYWGMLRTLHDTQDLHENLNGLFRGITNVMPGYWRVVGVTPEAYEVMRSRAWKGQFTKGLARDHMIPARDFQKHLMGQFPSFEELTGLVEQYGQCVICTKEQNFKGYGKSYRHDDVRWLVDPVDTHKSISLPASARLASFYQQVQK